MNHDVQPSKYPVRAILLVILIGAAIGVVVLGVRERVAYRATHATLPDGPKLEFLDSSGTLLLYEKADSQSQQFYRATVVP